MDAARFQEPRRRMIPIQSPWGDGEISVLDFGDPGRAVDVVFLHANGLNALTYRSMLAPLSASLRLIAPDLRGHGASHLPAEPRGRRAWVDFRDDVAALLEVLGGPPVTLAGHSMGATVALMAAAAAPARVANLVLFDPVIWSPAVHALARLPGAEALTRARMPLARGAQRRRSEFESRAAAFQAYRGRGMFAGWPETTLADYVAGGFHEREGGGVELACSPDWEASNFAAQGHDPWAALQRFDKPVRILKAERGTPCRMGDPRRLKRHFPNVTLETVTSRGHFFPIERPDLARDALLDSAV